MPGKNKLMWSYPRFLLGCAHCLVSEGESNYNFYSPDRFLFAESGSPAAHCCIKAFSFLLFFTKPVLQASQTISTRSRLPAWCTRSFLQEEGETSSGHRPDTFRWHLHAPEESHTWTMVGLKLEVWTSHIHLQLWFLFSHITTLFSSEIRLSSYLIFLLGNWSKSCYSVISLNNVFRWRR